MANKYLTGKEENEKESLLENYSTLSEEENFTADNNIENSSLIKSNYYKSSAFVIFFFPALGGLLFGYDIGGTSSVITQLQSSSLSGISWHNNVAKSSALQGFITASTMFGAVLGSLTCFSIADELGRKRSLILASILFFVGGIIEFISGESSFSYTSGLTCLIIGRLLYGYACGFAMHGAPAYIGEMAPSQIRGFLISLKEVFIVLGMVLGYSIGYDYSAMVGGWRYVYLWSCLFSFGMFCGMMYLPYSAR
jgi:MFS family permease